MSVSNDNKPGAYDSPFAVVNANGRGRIVLVCEHASSRVPGHLNALGLTPAVLESHIGWDIGALEMAKECSRLLDAPLLYATYSRLVLDLNRCEDAPDSIVEASANTPIPGNIGLSVAERARRQRAVYKPFHNALAALLRARVANDPLTAVVTLHSFTPVYRGEHRPWHIGILSDRDRRLADALLGDFRSQPDICCGDNQPYSPRDGVYHTLARHAQSAALPCVMIEVRDDGITDARGQVTWAQRLCRALRAALAQAQGSTAPRLATGKHS